MIFLFGAKRCKHCNDQKKYLQNTFGDNWAYVDVVNQEEALKIASDINLEGIPAIVAFDGKKEIFRKEGTIAPDQIFKAMYGDNHIPIGDGDSNSVVLSYEPKLERRATAVSYNGEYVGEIKITQCYRIAVAALPQRDKIKYENRGGRKDFGWFVSFEKI